MGEIISLTEAVRRYRIGEKTLRKWIRASQLEKKPDGQKRMTWEIDTDVLEQIIREKRTGTPTQAGIPVLSGNTEQNTSLATELSYHGEMLEAMKQEMGELRDRVAALEQGQLPVSDAPVAKPVSRQRVQTPRATQSTKPDLPDGWYAWTPFINRHGVDAERRAIMHLDRSDYCQPGEYMQSSARGKTLVKCALDATGQGKLLTQLMSMFASELGACDVEGCPCHQLLQKGLWS